MAILEEYFARTGMSVNDERYLFQPIQHTKNGEVLRGAGKISYSILKELFNKKLKQLRFPAESFNWPSQLESRGNNYSSQSKSTL